MSTGASAVMLAVDAAKVTPGLLGFLVVASLGVATWLLLRSMTRHLGRIDFEDPRQDPRRDFIRRRTSGPGDRSPGDRGPGDKGPGDRGPGDRSPGDRGPGDAPR